MKEGENRVEKSGFVTSKILIGTEDCFEYKRFAEVSKQDKEDMFGKIIF